MAIPTVHVLPGQLIRADLVNDIIDALMSFDARLRALEGGITSPPQPHQVTIATVSPQPVRVGQDLTVTGTNFDFSLAAAAVHLDSTPVPSFKGGSSDTQLVFTVPNLGVIPSGGRAFTMTVSNFSTSATRAVTILPQLVPFQGNVDIGYVSGTDIIAGQPAVLRFTATSTGAPAVKVTLSASVPGLIGITIFDGSATPQPIPGNQITIPAHGQVPFVVQVPIPTLPAGTKLTLTVDAIGVDQSVPTSPNVQELTVGAAAPTKDPTIDIALRGLDGGTQAGSTVSIPRGTTGELTIELTFRQAGDYDVTVALEPSTPQWTLGTDVPTPTPTTPSYTIEANDLVGGVATRTFLVDLTPQAGATAQPNLHVTASHKGAMLASDLLYKLNPT